MPRLTPLITLLALMPLAGLCPACKNLGIEEEVVPPTRVDDSDQRLDFSGRQNTPPEVQTPDTRIPPSRRNQRAPPRGVAPPLDRPMGDSGIADDSAEAIRTWQTAIEAYQAGQFEKASTEFKRYVKLTQFGGHSEQAELLSAEATFRLELYEDAYEAYRRFLRDFPNSPSRRDVGDRLHQIGVALVSGRGEHGLLDASVGNRALGRDILEAVVRDYEFESFADDALFHIAEDSRRAEDPNAAVEEFQLLLDRYSDSEWAPIAEFRLAQSLMAMSNGFHYDVSSIRRAERRLALYLAHHPEGDQSREAEQLMDLVRQSLAERELATAHFYEKAGLVSSARVYLESLVRDYPDTEAAARGRQQLRALGFEAPEPAETTPADDDEAPTLELQAPKFSPRAPPSIGPDDGPGSASSGG